MRRFHGVATRYLGNYFGWRRLIERHSRDISAADFLRAALGIDQGSTGYGCIALFYESLLMLRIVLELSAVQAKHQRQWM
jgi:hypothetical protein